MGEGNRLDKRMGHEKTQKTSLNADVASPVNLDPGGLPVDPVAGANALTTGAVPASSLGLVDRYVLKRKLGENDFGAVYLAEDTVSKIDVTVKTLPGLLVHNSAELERFRDNFAQVQKLVHPHIAKVKYFHKIVQIDRSVSSALRIYPGDYLLVMEYVEGSTLSAWRYFFSYKKVPVPRALTVCNQIASALDYAHDEKIVHRDIKPTNVMVTKTAGSLCVKVLDFDLAAEIRSSMSRVSQVGGNSSGTRPYMSPEQWVGKPQGAATDQYALAVLFYELVSGVVPFASAFETNDTAIMARVIEVNSAEPLLELSKRQNAALLRALSKRPEDRFASCGDFVVALGGQRLTFRSQSSGRDGVILKTAVAMALLLTLALGCGYGWRRYRTERAESPTVLAACEKMLDPDHAEAQEFKKNVSGHLLCVPAGFRMAPKTSPEPYTDTGWALEIIHEMTGIEMVYIPAGSFLMGSPRSEQDAVTATGVPREWVGCEIQHQVTLTQGYYLGKYVVTQAQWEKVMQEQSSDFQVAGAMAPVEHVSWEKCQEFCQKTGGDLRLPTEAEWEYACRAGTQTVFHYGDSLDASMANFDGNYPCGQGLKDECRNTTLSVGQFKPNAWGLYDMHGNGWEWCQDWYGAYPAEDVTDPTGAGSGKYRVLRGGSWDSIALICRSAGRGAGAPDGHDGGGGFRVCCSVLPVQ